MGPSATSDVASAKGSSPPAGVRTRAREPGADVAEPAGALQLIEDRGGKDLVAGELHEDVFVVPGTDAELRAQDMVAHVEDDLGGQLQAALGGPGVSKGRRAGGRVGAGEYREPGCRAPQPATPSICSA